VGEERFVSDAVRVELDGDGVARVTLNRPDRYNALSRELRDGFAQVLGQLKLDLQVRVVVLSGAGKHFCSGADIKDGIPALAAELGGGPVALRRAIRSLYEPFLGMMDLEVPTLAAVHGAAIGGGFGLALACDLRLAAENARLQANFVRLGIPPGMASTSTLPELVGPQRAAELLFTGRAVSGTEAAAIGLVLRAVPADSLQAEALALAREIALGAPEALRLTKVGLRRTRAVEARAAADREALAQAHCADMADAAEGVKAWLERRPPRFTGA
jgi:enoyl-CoA hydratase